MNCCVRPELQSGGGRRVIEMRRAQLAFGDGLIAETVSDLRDHSLRAILSHRPSPLILRREVASTRHVIAHPLATQ